MISPPWPLTLMGIEDAQLSHSSSIREDFLPKFLQKITQPEAVKSSQEVQKQRQNDACYDRIDQNKTKCNLLCMLQNSCIIIT